MKINTPTRWGLTSDERGDARRHPQGLQQRHLLATVQLGGRADAVAVERADEPRDRAGDMVVGRKVAVILFDPTNPADAVVAAVYT